MEWTRMRLKEGDHLTYKKASGEVVMGKVERSYSEPSAPSDMVERVSELETVCAELYQVIGSLASHAGVFQHPDVERALDNASQARLVHKDLLPWPSEPLRPPPLHPKVGPQLFVLDGVDRSREHQRLVLFDRPALERIWAALHDLNYVAALAPEKDEGRLVPPHGSGQWKLDDE